MFSIKQETHSEQNTSSTLPNRGLMAICVVGVALGLAASSSITGEDRVAGSESTTHIKSNDEISSSLLTNTTSIKKDDTSELFVPTDDSETKWFNNRPIRPVRVLKMRVTAYSPDEKSCGKHADGITASGYSVWTNGMKIVAADTDLLSFGTLLSIPGYDTANIVPVLDRGSAIKGNRLDVLFPTHEAALKWGVKELEVTVWEYADGMPDEFSKNHR